MRITRTPTRLTSLLTVDEDLDFLDTYQAGSLAAPAADEALRKGNKDITMAELADAIKNAAAGLVVLDASADVPLAQIPDTLTGKDAATVGGEAVADLEGTMDSKDATAITGLAKATSGTYTGDESANKAIAHGLGAIPRWVFIGVNTESGAHLLFWINNLNSDRIYKSVVTTDYAITAMTTTNFYVGNVAEYTDSANASGIIYAWLAIY